MDGEGGRGGRKQGQKKGTENRGSMRRGAGEERKVKGVKERRGGEEKRMSCRLFTEAEKGRREARRRGSCRWTV